MADFAIFGNSRRRDKKSVLCKTMYIDFSSFSKIINIAFYTIPPSFHNLFSLSHSPNTTFHQSSVYNYALFTYFYHFVAFWHVE